MNASTANRLPLHADFLLLAHDGESGKRLIDSQRYKVGLAAAAVSELVLQEALALDGQGKKAVFRASGADIDPQLQEALDRSVGRRPKDAIARIGGGQTWTDRAGDLNDATAAQLEADGHVRLVETKRLGLIPGRTMMVQDGSRAQALERVEQAMSSGMPPDAPTAALVTIAHGVGLLPKLVPQLSKKQVKACAEQIASQGWAADAIRNAINEVQAAASVGVVAAVGASS